MSQDASFAGWLRGVAPYIHAHRGCTFVLQISGEVVASDVFADMIHDLALLNSLGIKLVIVYGARPQIDALLIERNITPQYSGSLRVTDGKVISSVKQAVGEIRTQIEALLSMGLPNSPMAESAVTVASGNYIKGKPYGVVNGVNLNLTGRVRKTDIKLINDRLNADEIVLVPPLGYSVTGEIFNLSSIEVATRIAIDLAADKLIMLGNQPVLKDDQGQTIRQITSARARKMLVSEQNNNVDETPATALAQGIMATEAGIKRVHYIDQNIDGGILQELFSRDGVGSLLSATPFDVIQRATIMDIGGILELIKPLEEQGVLVKRSREKLELDIDDYIVLVRDGTVIACAALHFYSQDNVLELACMAVHPDYRNQSKGALLYEFVESLAREKGIRMLFALTTHAEHWFIERSFNETNLSGLPIEKQDIYNYQRNSKVLVKNLDSA